MSSQNKHSTKTNAKILLLDCETSPIRAFVWGLWDNNVALNQIDRDWYLLSAAWKWLGEKHVTVVGPVSTEDKHEGAEYAILSAIHPYLDKADIVVGHNAKAFDVKKLNAKFIEYGFAPPSPYRIVDTLLEARKHFKMSSNKLDYLANLLGFGNKIKTDFDLWKGCMAGDLKSWANLLKYNIKDVKLLEKIYLALRPWMTNHPNLGVYHDGKIEGTDVVCGKCGGIHIQWRGYATTNLSKFRRFQCLSCGGWGRSRVAEPGRVHVAASIV